MRPEPTLAIVDNGESANLLPGDVVLSFKKPFNLFEAIAHKAIQRYQEKLYPNGNNVYNHIRVVLGTYIQPVSEIPLTLLFEWTKPVSRVVALESWMLDSTYAHVYRSNYAPYWAHTNPIYYALAHSGKLYDFFQLIGVGLNWKIGLKNREHCSSGARKLLENYVGSNLFPEVEVWRTPPSSWANSPDWKRIIPIRGDI